MIVRYMPILFLSCTVYALSLRDFGRPFRRIALQTSTAGDRIARLPFFRYSTASPNDVFDDQLNDATKLTVEDAANLLRRAQELKVEALAMETALEQSRNSLQKKKDAESQTMFEKLFLNSRPLTPDAVARIIKEERWSVDQAGIVIDFLFQRWQKQQQDQLPSSPPQEFQIADVRNAAFTYNETDAQMTMRYAEILLQAAEILDQDQPVAHDSVSRRTNRWSERGALTLKSRWNELRRSEEEKFQRFLAENANIVAQSKNLSVESYMRMTLGVPSGSAGKQQINLTRAVEQVALVPMWVPSSLLPLMVASKAQVHREDVKVLKERILDGTGFFCTKSESIPSATLIRGNLRLPGPVQHNLKNSSAIIFEDIQRKMEYEGLSERIQLFLLQDPEWRPGIDERELEAKPVLLAVSKLVDPDDRMLPQTLVQTIIKRSSLVLTLVTVFSYALSCYALNPTFFDSIVNKRNASILMQCMPVVIGIFSIQIIHEAAHQIFSRRRGIKIGPPLPVPSPQLGTFGCITSMRSFPKNRSALMDFALSGPIASWIASVCLMAIGLLQTVRASSAALASFPFVPVALLKSSFLSGVLMSVFTPKALFLPLSQPMPVSPLVMIGFSGMYSAALNMLPIFRLDGGRACSAALGPRLSAIASAATLMLMLSIATSTNSGIVFAWGVFIALFQRNTEIPVRDDVTEVDDVRYYAWLASLLATVLSLAPFPGGPGFL